MSASHQAFLKQFPCQNKTTHERISAITETRRHKAPPQSCPWAEEFGRAGLVVR